MNWKLIFLLSMFGLAMGVATVFVIPSNIEPLFWLVIFLVCAWIIAIRAPGKYFVHGLMTSIVNSVWITAAHITLLGAYIANHQKEAQMMKSLPMSPTVMMMLTGPVVGVVSGIVLGLFAVIAHKLMPRSMKRVGATAVALLVAASAHAAPKKTSISVQRGAYLTITSGCHDCHSPKSAPGSMAPDALRILSGRPATTPAPDKPTPGQINASGDLTAWYGPWGVSYSSNLTPDSDTGMGKRYTEASFIRTMRTGKKPEGDPLLPPMPWPNYAKMTDEDLKSMYAYLQTLKPVKNFVRQAPPVPSR